LHVADSKQEILVSHYIIGLQRVAVYHTVAYVHCGFSASLCWF